MLLTALWWWGRVAIAVSYGVPTFVFPWVELLMDVAAKRVTPLGVSLPATCRIAFRGSSLLYSECCVSVGKTGAATTGVLARFAVIVSYGIHRLICAVFRILCYRLEYWRRVQWHPEAHHCYNWNLGSITITGHMQHALKRRYRLNTVKWRAEEIAVICTTAFFFIKLIL
jgi:hypothetical protein